MYQVYYLFSTLLTQTKSIWCVSYLWHKSVLSSRWSKKSSLHLSNNSLKQLSIYHCIEKLHRNTLLYQLKVLYFRFSQIQVVCNSYGQRIHRIRHIRNSWNHFDQLRLRAEDSSELDTWFRRLGCKENTNVSEKSILSMRSFNFTLWILARTNKAYLFRKLVRNFSCNPVRIRSCRDHRQKRAPGMPPMWYGSSAPNIRDSCGWKHAW